MNKKNITGKWLLKLNFVLLFMATLFSLTSCIRSKPSLQEVLRTQGVRVIHVGETIRMVLSSDLLFMPESANIRKCEFLVLDNVAKFLRQYQKVTIIVAAYKNASGDPQYDKALTRQQAYNVVTYLWNRGVDARIIEGRGYAGECRLSHQCALNRRVEIVFHYIPDYLHEMQDDPS